MTKSKPRVPEEAEVRVVIAELERLRPTLRECALRDLMRDGSRKAFAASQVIDVVLSALHAVGTSEVLELRNQVADARRRPQELRLLRQLIHWGANSEECKRLRFEVRKYEDAGLYLATLVDEALVGLADEFENLRAELPIAMDEIIGRRAELASHYAKALGDSKDTTYDYEWSVTQVRLTLRCWGVATKAAETMALPLLKNPDANWE